MHSPATRPRGRARFALAILGTILLAAGQAFAQSPIYVDAAAGNDGNDGLTPGTAKATVQAGLTTVAVGGTVIVYPGTYTENVVVNKNLTLVSTGGRAVTTLTGIANGALATIRVTGPTTGVQIGAVGGGFTINGIDNNNPGIENAAVYFQGNHSNAQVIDNEVVAAGDAGLLTEFGATISGFTISGNTFSGQTFVGPNPADYGFANQFTTPNVPRQLVVMGGGAGGGATSNIAFTGNTITGTAGGYNISTQEQGNNLVTIDANTATITGNLFTGTTTRFATSLRCRGPATTISGNTFSSAGLTPTTGHVYMQSIGSLASAVAAANTFDKGVYVDGTTATIGVNIQVFVGVVPPATTVRVLAGTYEEQVVITTSNLTLQGAGAGSTVIRSPVTLAASFTTPTINKPVVFVNGATNVTIQDLTVDGYGRGNSNYRFVGVAYWNAGGKLANASVIGVRDTPLSGAQHGVGVYAFNNTAGPYALEVASVTVSDFQKAAMALNGNANLTVNVHDCTTTGAGAFGTTAQNGIQIWGASGTVANCSISGVFYTGPSYTASGLLFIDDASITVSGTNPITGCQTAIYSQNSNCNVGGANVSGTTTWGAVLYNPAASKAGAEAMPVASRPEASPYGEESLAKAGLPHAQVANTMALHDGCLTGTDAAGSEGVEVYSAGGPLAVTLERLEIRDWDLGVAIYGAASAVTANDNAITSNVTAGLDNSGSLAAQDAQSNWWGAANGPSGTGPGSGDAVLGTGVDFSPWLIAGTDLAPGCGFQPPADNVVTPAPPGSCISTVNPCVTVPMNIARTTSDHIRGYSVTFTLSSELMLCSGLGSITQGNYLSLIGGTTFQVLDNGGGSYTVDCAILGLPCGATAATGNLFNVAVKNSGGNGTGTVTVTSVLARDCSNGPVAASPGDALAITIDNTAPVAVANLQAAQKKTGNDSDGTTKIQLTFTAPIDAAVVEVYRAGFGAYPEYDDNGGSAPAAPSYPPGGPWALTAVTASGQYDEVAAPRDFWYYVVFAKDACGNVSPVSNRTNGTLNYHLGDVSDAVTPGTGNNLVNTADISLLGAHYGITLGSPPAAWDYLDVGPTTDYSVDARPTTDNRVQFEDLMMFAINYGQVSKSSLQPHPASSDELIVLAPEGAEPGGTLVAHLWMRGTGRIQGLTARLRWDAAIVEPIGMQPEGFLRDQDGVAFAPEPGTVDVALLGVRPVALAGEGDLATVRFRVIAAGDPGIGIAAVDARDATNRRVELGSGGTSEPQQNLPRVTALLACVPNPFNPTTQIPFTLAAPGPVDVAIYTVTGRKVRSLVHENRGAGLHECVWNGADDGGVRVASGTYYVRLVTRDGTQSRPVVLLK